MWYPYLYVFSAVWGVCIWQGQWLGLGLGWIPGLIAVYTINRVLN